MRLQNSLPQNIESAFFFQNIFEYSEYNIESNYSHPKDLIVLMGWRKC